MASNQPVDGPPSGAIPPGEPTDRLGRIATAPRRAAYTPAYTRVVRRLRIALPLAGVAVIGVVALWPHIVAYFDRPTDLSQDDRRAQMINTRYVGADSHGRPYTITADATEQSPGGGLIEMISPLAELTLANGRWVALKAEHGHYDQAAGWVDLTGHVELFHDGGYRFTTERAHIEFTQDLVWGDRAVQGHGPKGEVEARGFRIVDKDGSVVFTGPARLMLRPKAAALPDPNAKVPHSIADALSDSGPTTITATQDIQWLQQDRAYVAHGQATARQGAGLLTADSLTAYYREQTSDGGTEIWRAVADGNVHVADGEREAFGDRMDYDADKHVVVLTGKALKAMSANDVVTARDSLEYWQDRDLLAARGDALVRRGDQTLSSDVVLGRFAANRDGHKALKSIDAVGHVVISSPNEVVRGDQGAYDMETRRALVTGNVVALHGESRIEGGAADVDQASGVSRLFPVAGKRVHGYFVSRSTPRPGAVESSAEPLDITAEEDFEWRQQDRAYVARGRAIAKRGDATLIGNVLVGYYRSRSSTAGVKSAPPRSPDGNLSARAGSGNVGLDGENTEIWRVVATGDVHLSSNGRDAYGDRMDYDADRQVMAMTGERLHANTTTDEVTARDSLEYFQDGDVAVARGDAMLNRSDGKKLGGDSVAAFFAKDKSGHESLDKVRASGRVTVTTTSDIVHGEQGTYDGEAKRAVVTGNVRMTRGTCQLDGDSAEVDQVSGISQVFQAAGKRVSGLFSQNCGAAAASNTAKGNHR